MAKAVITLTDNGDGQFEARCDYEEGFNPESPACVYGHQLMQYLDVMAERRGPETIIGNAPSGHAEDRATRSILPAIANTVLPNADSTPGAGNH